MSAATTAAARIATAPSASSGGPLRELRIVEFFQRCLQLLARRSQVLQELDLPIEVDYEGLVLVVWAHEVVEEAVAGDALLLDQTALARAGVHQQSQGEGHVSHLGEIVDGLRLAVLLQFEVVFGQVVDDLPVLVEHRGENVDDLDVRGEGWRLLGPQVTTRQKNGGCEQHEKALWFWGDLHESCVTRGGRVGEQSLQPPAGPP